MACRRTDRESTFQGLLDLYRLPTQKSSDFLSNFPFPARSSSHTQDLFNHFHRKFLMKKRGIAYTLRGGLVQAHLRTQVLHVLPTRFWNVMHFVASTFHESTPAELLSARGSKLRPPVVMAFVPHFGTHFRHALQNSVMPESTAPAGSSGRSVNILEILQRAPTLGLINRPCLPICPRPRIDSQRDAQRCVIGSRYGVVAQPSNELSQHP